MGAGDVARRLACSARKATAAAILAAALPLGAVELQATSSDGRWLLRADNVSRSLEAVDARSGALVRRIPVADQRGATSRVTRVLDAPARRSFVVLLADLPEAWELPYDPQAAPVFDGLVHDYRMGEGLPSRGPLPVRRIVLDVPLTDALFSPDHAYFVAGAGGGIVHVVSLDVRRVIERLPVGGDPAPERGLGWISDGVLRFAVPDSRAARVHVLASNGWRSMTAIELPSMVRLLLLQADGRPAAELESGESVTLPR